VLLLSHQNWFGHVHPIEMGYHDTVSEGNHVCEWCNVGQSNVKTWLCLLGSAYGANYNFCDSLDLEGVHCYVILGDNEPKKASCGDAKYTLERVQEDIILETYLKDDA
jgi:hypothetical protein